MGRLPITQFNFQLLDSVVHCLELLQLSPEPIAVGEAFVELRNLFTQNPDLFFLNLARLLSEPTGLQGIPDFVRLRRRQ